MATFRKKPVVIEAHQWGMQNDASMPDWLRGAVAVTDPSMSEAAVRAVTEPGQARRYQDALHIGTLEGVMTAFPGDWIIRSVKGEIYPCKPDIFAATYEAA